MTFNFFILANVRKYGKLASVQQKKLQIEFLLIFLPQNRMDMKIEKNTVVALSYTLYKDNENGEVLEVCKAEKPLEFLFGAGMLLPKFEDNIAGLEVGDDFDFALTPSEAYGERTDEAIVEVPIQVFSIDGAVQKDLLYPGNTIPMRDAQGHPLNGVVVRVEEDSVVMDFNNPLAGVDLFFSGKIESVREATEEELAHGLHRGCGGCHCGGESSCNSGDCGSDCGDGGCCGGCH